MKSSTRFILLGLTSVAIAAAIVAIREARNQQNEKIQKTVAQLQLTPASGGVLPEQEQAVANAAGDVGESAPENDFTADVKVPANEAEVKALMADMHSKVEEELKKLPSLPQLNRKYRDMTDEELLAESKSITKKIAEKQLIVKANGASQLTPEEKIELTLAIRQQGALFKVLLERKLSGINLKADRS